MTFQVDDPEFDDGPSPYVGLTIEGQRRALRYLRNPKEKILQYLSDDGATLVIDYPLRNGPSEVHVPRLPSGEYTRVDLIRMIGASYRMIYQEERETSTLAEESCAQRYGGFLMNRAATNGKWGIWGHDLSDLLLHTITLDVANKKLHLGIDS